MPARRWCTTWKWWPARERSDAGSLGIATGLAALDSVLNGGPNRDSFVIVGARPSMGKTAFAVNIACNVARYARVLMLSMEMTNDKLLDRVLTQLGSIPLDVVTTSQLDEDQAGRMGKATTVLARPRPAHGRPAGAVAAACARHGPADQAPRRPPPGGGRLPAT